MAADPAGPAQGPGFDVPALACDCHAHILGPQGLFPYVENRSFTPPDALEADYAAMLAGLGLERMVLVQASVYGTDNRRLLNAIETLGRDRARGVAMVGKDVTRAELERLHAGGVRAVRYIATAGGGPALAELPHVAEAVAPLGWHIEAYMPPELLPELLQVAVGLPVRLVFDHMGGLPADTRGDDPALEAILRLLEGGNAWVKLIGYRNSLAGPPYGDVQPLARIFAEHAPERCVWGTDWPHTNIPAPVPADRQLFALLGEWVPDPRLREQILVHNPAALYGF